MQPKGLGRRYSNPYVIGVLLGLEFQERVT